MSVGSAIIAYLAAHNGAIIAYGGAIIAYYKYY